MWSGSFNWLNNFTSIDDPRIFGTAIPDVRGLSYRKIMNYADEIKSRLTMQQVLDYYGIERNRANRIRCVLHNGQDFNCGIKDHYIHCFVCGQSADVIKFVQVYFCLDFQSAISKLNDDFKLGLPIGKKIDRRTQLEMNKAAFERKRKAEQQKKNGIKSRKIIGRLLTNGKGLTITNAIMLLKRQQSLFIRFL